MTTEIKDFAQLPLTLTVEEVGQVLGIGRVKAYELANSENFTCKIRIGKRIIIPRDSFIKWINSGVSVA